MRRLIPLLLLLGLALPAPRPASAQQEIRLATWNIAWLTLKPAGHPDLPRDIRARTPEDFRLLRGYAERLNADIVAIQEIDGEAAAARVLAKLIRSHSIVSTVAPGAASLMRRSASELLEDLRLSITRCAPLRAQVNAHTKPVPVVQPVIATTLPVRSGRPDSNFVNHFDSTLRGSA